MGNPTILGSSFVPLSGPGNETLCAGMGTCGWASFFESPGGSTEAKTQLKTRSAGVFTRAGVQIVTNSKTSSCTMGLRVNGANVNNAASITSTTTGYFRDTTNSDTIADGDLCNFRITSTSNLNSIIPSNMAIELTPTSNTVQYFSFTGNDDNLTQSSASSTGYANIAGSAVGSSPETTIANAKGRLRVAGVANHVQIYAATNGFTGAGSVNVYKNGSAGSGTASITGSTTGLFEDTTNSDTFAAGDDINFSWVSGSGSGSLVATQIACKYKPTSTDFEMAAASNTSSGGGFNTTDPRFQAFTGACEVVYATEASAKMKVMLALVIDKLRINQSANSSTTSVTATVRKNGSDTALTLSITNNTTGLFEDTTHSFTVADGDDINLKFTNPNSSTFAQRFIAVRADSNVPTAPAGVHGKQRGMIVLQGQ